MKLSDVENRIMIDILTRDSVLNREELLSLHALIGRFMEPGTVLDEAQRLLAERGIVAVHRLSFEDPELGYAGLGEPAVFQCTTLDDDDEPVDHQYGVDLAVAVHLVPIRTDEP